MKLRDLIGKTFIGIHENHDGYYLVFDGGAVQLEDEPLCVDSEAIKALVNGKLEAAKELVQLAEKLNHVPAAG